LDITNFPVEPASLAAFKWVHGNGSYQPFINTMQELYASYHPMVAGYDATGTQKAFDDLGVLDQRQIWLPLDLSGKKMHMVLCLKVLMGKGLIHLPKSVYSIWNQLLMWCMPDKQLRQDIASTLFMAGYLLNQLLPMTDDEDREPALIPTTGDRWTTATNMRLTGSLRL